jgi:DNA-binding CsgD family transcriptional regulator
MSYFKCLDELLKAMSSPALLLNEEIKVVLRNFPKDTPCPWENESTIGKTLFDLFPGEQGISLHDTCLDAIELKRPAAQQITVGAIEQQLETTAKLIPYFNPDSNSWYVILLLEYDSHAASSVAQKTEPDKQQIGDELRTKSEVEDARAALRFLLREGEKQIIRLREETLSSLGNQFFPFVEGLKSTKLSRTQEEYVNMIESCARRIAEPFTRKISDSALRLSPTEIKIAGLIRIGKRNKEMAKIMNLSQSTILTHRHHIRSKLGLRNRKQNLRGFLASMGTNEDIGKNPTR